MDVVDSARKPDRLLNGPILGPSTSSVDPTFDVNVGLVYHSQLL